MFKPNSDSFEFENPTVVTPTAFYRRHQSTDWLSFMVQACKDYLDDGNDNDFVTIVEAMTDNEEGYNPTAEEAEEWAEDLLELADDEDYEVYDEDQYRGER